MRRLLVIPLLSPLPLEIANRLINLCDKDFNEGGKKTINLRPPIIAWISLSLSIREIAVAAPHLISRLSFVAVVSARSRYFYERGQKGNVKKAYTASCNASNANKFNVRAKYVCAFKTLYREFRNEISKHRL